jgi:endoglucanase Acf2
MPAPPAQTNVNHYAGIEMINGTIWSLYASHPDQSYSYQIRQGVSSVGQQGSSSAGGFSSEGDLEYLADTTQGLYDFAGLNAETPGGVSILDPASGGNWSYQFVVASESTISSFRQSIPLHPRPTRFTLTRI